MKITKFGTITIEPDEKGGFNIHMNDFSIDGEGEPMEGAGMRFVIFALETVMAELEDEEMEVVGWPEENGHVD